MGRDVTRVLLCVVALAMTAAGRRPPGLGDVSDIRIFDHAGHTRVVVEVSRDVRYSVGELSSPPRLYVDIEGAWIEAPLATGKARGSSGPVRRVRGGQNTLQRARIVVELDRSDRRHRTFHLSAPFRIVTDVYNADAAPPAPIAVPSPLPRESSGPQSFDARPVRRIAIDAGHGGKDPGALGHGGLREKDVTLRISRELRRQLSKQGFEVVLTRERDVFLPLQRRTEIANQRNADLFLSIHANAARNRKVSGVETYLLDTRYDKQTARVAARENGTTVGELSQLQLILASLRLGYQERFAARSAETIHSAMLQEIRREFGKVPDHGVKRGPFLVLFQADMPAILIEVGFVSNRKEAGRLKTAKFAREVAEGITRGVVRYRDEHARSLVAER